MAKGGKPKFTVAQIADALEKAGGVDVAAAALLKCSPSTIRNYCDRHESLRRVKATATEDINDLAEHGLIKAIREGNLTAIIFRLKTKAKDRGYVERTALIGGDPEDLPVAFTEIRHTIIRPEPRDT